MSKGRNTSLDHVAGLMLYYPLLGIAMAMLCIFTTSKPWIGVVLLIANILILCRNHRLLNRRHR